MRGSVKNLLLANKPGLPKRGLIANYPFNQRNLLRYSEQFDQATNGWTKTRSSVTAKVIANPLNGALTGCKLIEDTTAASSHYIHTSPLYPLNTPICFSVYAKADTRSKIMLQLYNGTEGNLNRTVFDLVNGTYAIIAGSFGSGMTYLGNGWYRCWAWCTPTVANTTTAIYLYDNNTTYDGDGTSGLYIYGAQVEIGTVPTDYQKTSINQYIWDYNKLIPRKNLCRVTNRLADSSSFGWIISDASMTVTGNQTDVFGGNTAVLINDTSSSLNVDLSQVLLHSYDITAETVCVSAYFKKGTADKTRMWLHWSNSTLVYTDKIFSWDANGVPTPVSSELNIENAGDGWYRIWFTSTNTDPANTAVRFGLNPADYTTDGASTGSVYMCCPQVEFGTSPTPYQVVPNAVYYDKSFPYIGNHLRAGATTGVDATDPQPNGYGSSFDGGDYYYYPHIETKQVKTAQIVFYTASTINSATAGQILINFGTESSRNKFIGLGSVTSLLTDEIICVGGAATGSSRSGWCGAGSIAVGWHIIEIIYSGISYDVYLDGVKLPLTSTTTPAELITLNPGETMYIGSGPGANYFTGYIGYIGMWDRSISKSELKASRKYAKQIMAQKGVTLNVA